MMYPPNWPKCVMCGEPVLDGHLTCGRLECDEQAARDASIRESLKVAAGEPEGGGEVEGDQADD